MGHFFHGSGIQPSRRGLRQSINGASHQYEYQAVGPSQAGHGHTCGAACIRHQISWLVVPCDTDSINLGQNQPGVSLMVRTHDTMLVAYFSRYTTKTYLRFPTERHRVHCPMPRAWRWMWVRASLPAHTGFHAHISTLASNNVVSGLACQEGVLCKQDRAAAGG